MTMTLSADALPAPRRGLAGLFRKTPAASPRQARTTLPETQATVAEDASRPSGWARRKSWALPLIIAVPALVALIGASAFFWAGTSSNASVEAGVPELSAEEARQAEARPLLVPRLVDPTATSAADYEIVSLFDDEAMLATRGSIYRVKPGQSLPGIGTILSVTSTTEGGTIEGSEATLRMVNAAP